MNVMVPIPDALAAHFGSEAELARCAVEAIALEQYRAGGLTRPELHHLLGLPTRAELDAFLNTRGVVEGITTAELDRQMQDPNGTRRMPDDRDSASVDALMHETGNGVNYRDSIWRNVSNSDSFKAAYDQDSHTGRLAQPYYHQDNDGQAGRDEAFAESFAMYTKDPAAMQRDYPHLYAFFQNFMQSHGVGAP